MFEKYLRNKTILSAAGIIMGVILMIWRGQVVETMIRVMGYMMIATAAVYLFMYFRENRQNEMMLGYAIMSGGAGLLLVLLCRVILNAFPVIIGVVLIMSGAAALLETCRDREIPLYSKLLSILIVVLGVLILIHPGRIANAIVFCTGFALVVNGISGLLMSRQI